MAEPQLSVRSAKAKEIAHRLARQTNSTVGRVVEEALVDLEVKLAREARQSVDEFWAPVQDLLEEGGRLAREKGVTSTGDDEFFDETGLPKL